ncbi:MAG TPA: hypothetical protein VMT52_10735 [Planctomycetota bacterium]|nr:hypothetical protein [Planctomycetota bacterium]
MDSRTVRGYVVLAATVLAARWGSAEETGAGRAIHEEKLEEIIRRTTEARAAPSVLAGVDLARASRAVLAAVRALRIARVDVAFEKTGMKDVLDLLQSVSGLPFIMTKKAREACERDRVQVTLELKGLSLESVLDILVLQLDGFRFVVRHGAVVLLREEEYRPERVLLLYNVSDLVRERPDFPAPPLALPSRAP